LFNIMGQEPTQAARKQSSLAISKGGLGLPLLHTSRKAAAAYVASVAQTLPMIRTILGTQDIAPGIPFDAALASVNQKLPAEHHANLQGLTTSSHPQHDLWSILDDAQFQLLKSANGSPAIAATLNGVSAHHALDFLHTVPIPSLKLAIPNEEFQVALQVILGLRVLPHGMCEGCGIALQDPLGQHTMSCAAGGYLLKRHNAHCDNTCTNLKKGAWDAMREKADVLAHIENGAVTLEPADIHITMWEGFETALDFSFVSPTQAAIVSNSAMIKGFATAHRDNQKRSKYQFKCDEARIQFIPMSVETFGGYSDAALAFFDRMLVAVHAKTRGKTFAVIKDQFFQKMSLLTWKYNAQMILQRRSS
jgi:hypothetical protein